MRDYSDWLTPARLAWEEEQWADPTKRTWPVFVAAIERVRRAHGLTSVIEFGCGTGWVPAALPEGLSYVGVDANRYCIEMAVAKNLKTPNRIFVVGDVREHGHRRAQLACAFSFLKHFGLREWVHVAGVVLNSGQRGLFSIPYGDEAKDDGADFPHITVNESLLQDAVLDAGHCIVSRQALPWGEVMVETCRL